MKIPFIIVIVTTLVLSFHGCKTASDADTVNEHDSVLIEFNTMFGVQSNMEEVVNMMIRSGFIYTPEITIDTAIKEDYYQSDNVAALMCGVFSADAIYHSAFGNSDAAFESYTSAQELANFVGIGPYYVENLLKRAEQGLTEADSLLYKFDKVLSDVDTTLNEEKRMRIIASYLIGNLIEKMYLVDKGVQSLEGKKLVDISDEAKTLYKYLILEKKSVDMFVDIIDRYAVNKGNPLYVEMVSLQTVFEEFYNSEQPEYKPDDIYKPTPEMEND